MYFECFQLFHSRYFFSAMEEFFPSFWNLKHAQLNDITSFPITRKFSFQFCESCSKEWNENFLHFEVNPRSRQKRISLNRRAINSIHFPTNDKMTEQRRAHKNRELCDWHETSNDIDNNLILLGIIALKWSLFDVAKRLSCTWL